MMREVIKKKLMKSFKDLSDADYVKGGNKAANARYAKLAKRIARG
jgi:hypothetical protein